MSICRNYSGFCPHFNEECTIEIDYMEVPILGSMKKHFKRGSFDCYSNEGDECIYAHQNRCPVYEQAPVTIEE